MELLWEEAALSRLIYCASEQTIVEGRLPATEGRRVAEVLDSSARAAVDNTDVNDNEVTISGRIIVSVIALDESGSAFAFESTAEFSHSFEVAGAAMGMSAYVSPSVQSLSAHAAEGAVDMSCAIDMELRVTAQSPLRMTAGVSGVSDIEMRHTTVSHARRVELGHDTLRLREELAEDGISDVILTEGQVCIRDTIIEQGGATVSGTITVSSICTDADGKLIQLVRQMPFRERLAVSGAAEGVYCHAVLNAIALRSLGSEFNLLAMEAEVSFRIYGVQTESVTLPVDLFSPSIGFECLKQNLRIQSFTEGKTVQSIIRETVTVPDGMADISESIFAAARPVVTSVSCNDNGVAADGILITRMVYRSAGDRIYTFSEDIPFTISIADGKCDLPIITASATASVTNGGGRNAQVMCGIVIDAELYSVSDVSVVTGLAETAAKASPNGIVVCFASEGECVFDIAKRYCVPCATVRQLNPEAVEPFADGTRLVLLS